MANERLDGDTTNSIGEDLRAAMREATEGAPAPVEGEVPGDIPEAPAPASEPVARADGRDEHGRFKPKEGDAAKPLGQNQNDPNVSRETLALKPAQTGTGAGQPEAVTTAPVAAPPPGWSVKSKAEFAALPEHVRADIAKREQEVAAGFKRYEGLGATMREFETVLTPRMAEFQRHGVTPVQGVARLFAAFDALEHNPAQSLVTLANEAGVDLAQLAGMQRGAAQPQNGAAPQQGQPGFRDPRVDDVVNYINQVRQQDAVFEQQTADQTIAEFASDTKNVYFENVRPVMVRLLSTPGGPQTLKDAYDWACAMNPDIQQAVINARVADKLKEQQKAQQQRVTSARSASGSLSGAPSPGSVGMVAPKDNLREELQEAMRASRA